MAMQCTGAGGNTGGHSESLVTDLWPGPSPCVLYRRLRAGSFWTGHSRRNSLVISTPSHHKANSIENGAASVFEFWFQATKISDNKDEESAILFQKVRTERLYGPLTKKGSVKRVDFVSSARRELWAKLPRVICPGRNPAAKLAIHDLVANKGVEVQTDRKEGGCLAGVIQSTGPCQDLGTIVQDAKTMMRIGRSNTTISRTLERGQKPHSEGGSLSIQIVQKATRQDADMIKDLQVVCFTNSGSEANDLALHMARLYTGVYDTISLRNAYHGMSPYLMGLTAISTWRYNTPTGFGIHQAMNPDPFRGPWGGARCRDSPSQTIRSCNCAEGECEASDLYVEQLEDTIRFSMPKDKVGAFFAESVQGVGGAVQFPKNYLKRAFELVRSKGGLCVSDEVQTGFGRMGSHYWGFETHDVIPDIVTIAKGMGNGFPMAAVITTPEVADVLGKALHFNTFGGNPVACAVGSEVLDVIDDEKRQEHCAVVGTRLIHKLRVLQEEFDFVGDVRGKGLMIGVEMVTDKKSRKPMSGDDVGDIWEDTKDMGILLGRGGLYGIFRIKPPMCITDEDIDYAVAIMRRAFENYAVRRK
ncbi:alanine--glyoxylate aminotransferase 2, mitochondrial-like [Haliotis rubra]|uniref:alanine--glyoxylate aminotransferase 2, mitochondrial-like n=1 Tax=Haliotis rubra TaxID=36100 RepID=UPI001EE4FBF2|nr:alanine--glyoxylate aminotransferase 2, mitochondrial-like [Haliotis rubra]